MWVKRSPYYDANLLASYNHLDWFPAERKFIFDRGFRHIEKWDEQTDEVWLEWLPKNGTNCTRAKEAQPKIITPLWEEREV